MDNNYINNGYIICKSIGDIINNKHCKPVKCQSKADIEYRLNFLKSHNLMTLSDFVIDKDEFISFLGEDKYRKLSSVVNKAVFRQIKNDLMSNEISTRLSENGVKNIILKGTELSKFYPENIVRTSNDIDIYIDKKDFKTTDKILSDNGFTFENTFDNQEFSYKKDPGYFIELHTTMEGFNKHQKKILKSLADNATCINGNRYVLTYNDCYIYSLFHLYKHFILSGVGVRMFLDIYLVQKNTSLDFDYIATKLKALGINKFAETVTEINCCLFENKKADDELKEVIEFIFNSGTFGKTSSNIHLKEINSEMIYESNLEKFKIDNGLGFISMKKRYPILKKLPFLYPISFIHRFFYGIIHKRDVIKNTKDSKNFISKDRVNNYKKIFDIMKID